MARLSIHLIGPFSAQLDGVPITSFESDKVRALLAYLAVEADLPHRREHLAGLLWPEQPDRAARANLRNALSNLRKNVQDLQAAIPFLITTRQTISINPDSDVWVDIWAFNTVAAKMAVADVGLDNLKETAEFYRGSFLQGFFLGDSIHFEEWALLQREMLDRQARTVFDQLARLYRAQGNLPRAITYLRKLNTLEPWDETTHRALMAVLAANNQRSEALQQYQTCVQALQAELGIFPDVETTALYEHILTGIKAEGKTHSDFIRGYEAQEELGEGKFGKVYRAHQFVVERDVAVKVIRPKFANHPEFIRQFEVEAQLVARLEHPHIVPLYDYWRDPSGAYLVMRWLRGGSLAESLKAGPWPPDRVVLLVEQIAAALAFAHLQNVVHRDIKPGNILLDEFQNGFLTDFGIASLINTVGDVHPSGSLEFESYSSGSLGYQSPEIILRQPATIQTDIYSLGVVLFELLTGQHPFPGLSGPELQARHQYDSFPPVQMLQPALPPAVDLVIQQATAKKPEERFLDAQALARALRMSLLPEIGLLSGIYQGAAPVRNPFKGLAPFLEIDSQDFFGRSSLVARLAARLAARLKAPDARFLAVIGPSGSGKSSVVKAGLIPALRQGALPGSRDWYIAEMTPGAQPLHNLESAVMRVAAHPQDELIPQIKADPTALGQIVQKSLPDPQATMLLVIDQFEELYTLVVDPVEREQFIAAVASLDTRPESKVCVVITLRADFYDRPLRDPVLGELVQMSNEVVLPQTPAEVEAAITLPAKRVGVNVEPALVAALTADVGEQPGALPLLQYTLTELFANRTNHTMTLAAYRAAGGVAGTLGKRAETIFQELEPSDQAAAQQLFLRLVTLGEGVEDTRRRALQAELEALSTGDPDSTDSPNAIQHLLVVFGKHRLLTFDRNPGTRSPTVEVAHEALLSAWLRLRDWLDASREDIRLQRALGQSSADWQASGRDPSYLLRGARLDMYALWMDETSLVLTRGERRFLNASLNERRRQVAAEAARQARETALEQRSRNFLQALLGVFALAALVAVILSGVAFTQRAIALDQQSIAESEAQARATAEAGAVAERDRAVNAEQEALRQASIGLAAAAVGELTSANSERAVLLALAALEEYPYTPQAEAALARVVQEALPYREMVDKNGFGLGGFGIDWSPDDRRIALGANSNPDGEHSALIFDAETGQIETVLPISIPNSYHSGWPCHVPQIKFSPNGEQIALVGNNILYPRDEASNNCHLLQVYDLAGNLIHNFETAGEFAFDWSPDGRRLLTGDENGLVRILDIESGTALRTLDAAAYIDDPFDERAVWVVAVNYAPDGTKAAVRTLDGPLLIWDMETGVVLQTLPNLDLRTDYYDGFYVRGIAWSTDGSQLGVAGADGVGRVFDWQSGEIVRTLAGHQDELRSIEWSPDGKFLATNGDDYMIRVWSTATGNELSHFPVENNGSIAWSSDSRQIAAALQEGLGVWDLSVLPPVLGASKELNFITLSLKWSQDGGILALGSDNGVIYDWSETPQDRDAETGEGWIGLAPTGDRMVTSQAVDWSIAQIVDLYSGEVLTKLETPAPGEQGVYYCHAWSPDGSQVASSAFPAFNLVVWDPITGQELAWSKPVGCFMIIPSFSPDGRYLATGCMFGEGNTPVYILDPDTAEIIRELPSEDGWSIMPAWSPDGKKLAVGQQGGTVTIWDVERWVVESEFNNHQALVKGIAWSPSGERIASGDDNSLVYVWDPATNAIVQEWRVPGSVISLAWHPDGNMIGATTASLKLPVFRRVWESTQELIDYAYDCCVWRELTPVEREQFGLQPTVDMEKP